MPWKLKSFLWRHSAGIAFFVMAGFVTGVGILAWHYVLITRKFDSSQRWDLPSRIYSDATPIVPGLAYPRALLEPKINHVGYHAVEGEPSNPGEYRFADENLEIYLQDFAYPDMEFHAMPVRVEFRKERCTKITRLPEGAALKAIRIEPELITSIYDDVMEDRTPVPLNAVPRTLVQAVLAAEDRNFFYHEGVSIRGIARAALTNLRSGGVRAGGSTLTQQLVKNLYLDASRSYIRKIREILMAVMLDARYTKDEILEAYLNEIYLGQNGAVQINGVEQASRVYFSKSVSYLTLGESATLAGMIPSPNVYSPLKYPERALTRRNLVLRSMLTEGMINPAQYKEAVAAPLSLNRFPKSYRSAPYFVDLVRKQLAETWPQTQLQTEGFRIFTTLDTMMQRAAEEALEKGATGLAKKHPKLRSAESPIEGAVLTMQPGTGYVKALVGGRSYSRSQFNRVLQAKRQPGSLFKPFVYAAAMDPARGPAALTASTLLDDSSISVKIGKTEWKPQNYDGTFHGTLSLRRALAMSYNIPAVRAAIDAGIPNVVRIAQKIGVSSRLQPYPSISLGSFEVTPLEIALAYSVFANEGVRAEPVSILAVITKDGKVLERRDVKMERVIPPGLCFIINDMLKEAVRSGTGAKVRAAGFSEAYAGKTGTTNDYRDAWFVGYSPRILTTVWVGFDDGRAIGLAGSEAALPIWLGYMRGISGMVPDTDYRRPQDVVMREIDPATGMLATPWCPRSIEEFYLSSTQPMEVCHLHAGVTDPRYPFLQSDLPGRRMSDPQGTVRPRDGSAGAAARKPQGRTPRMLRWLFR